MNQTGLNPVLTAVAAGALLGPGDLLAQRALPYPWADLADSSAVWALAAFAIGAGRRAAADQAPGWRRPPSCCCALSLPLAATALAAFRLVRFGQ